MKKIIPIAIALVVIIVAIFLLSNDRTGHIEDTNGEDNYQLEKISDENISKMDVEALNISQKTGVISGMTTAYHSNCFTGVYEAYSVDVDSTRVEITVNYVTVNKGNFRIALCVDDKIVHEFEVSDSSQTFALDDASGSVSLRLAGESADFSCDFHAVVDDGQREDIVVEYQLID